jgi:hypothetical protein
MYVRIAFFTFRAAVPVPLRYGIQRWVGTFVMNPADLAMGITTFCHVISFV